MASGYYIYSIDANKFQNFIENPTEKHLQFLAKDFRFYIDLNNKQYLETDRCHDWPSDISELAVEVSKRLQKPDWYGDLNEREKSAWEMAFTNACKSKKHVDIGFHVVGKDSVSLDFIASLQDALKIKEFSFHRSKKEMAKFGIVPYRASPSSIHRPTPIYQKGPYYWYPMHSMHTPDGIEKILEELQSVEKRFLANADAIDREQYTTILLKSLKNIHKDGSLLYVQVSF